MRGFRREAPPEAVVTELLELGNLAPSVGNLQARDFIVVRDKQVKEKLAAAARNQQFILGAPVLLVVCANLERIAPYGSRGKELLCFQDATVAIANIMLAACAKGLGSCWVATFDEGKAIEALKLPPHARPVAILPIGYPADDRAPTGRYPIEELTHRDTW